MNQFSWTSITVGPAWTLQSLVFWSLALWDCQSHCPGILASMSLVWRCQSQRDGTTASTSLVRRYQFHSNDNLATMSLIRCCQYHSNDILAQRWGIVRSTKRCRHCILGQLYSAYLRQESQNLTRIPSPPYTAHCTLNTGSDSGTLASELRTHLAQNTTTTSLCWSHNTSSWPWPRWVWSGAASPWYLRLYEFSLALPVPE